MQATLAPADQFSTAELLDIWNRGFSGYYVDNTMDEARLARHLRWSAVDLARSAVLLVDAKPAAFSLAAIERRGGGLAAWIAGFGVAPEHRRKGLAGMLMRAHCEILDIHGIAETLLEVIEENPARRVYQAAGFRETRALISLQGGPSTNGESSAAKRVELSRLEELHGAMHEQSPPVWRRELSVLRRILADQDSAQLLAVGDDDGYSAYALALPGEERVSLLDVCAADAAAARRLVDGLAEAYPGRNLRLIDEPEGSPMALALAAAGMGLMLRQMEMVRTP